MISSGYWGRNSPASQTLLGKFSLRPSFLISSGYWGRNFPASQTLLGKFSPRPSFLISSGYWGRNFPPSQTLLGKFSPRPTFLISSGSQSHKSPPSLTLLGKFSPRPSFLISSGSQSHKFLHLPKTSPQILPPPQNKPTNPSAHTTQKGEATASPLICQTQLPIFPVQLQAQSCLLPQFSLPY